MTKRELKDAIYQEEMARMGLGYAGPVLSPDWHSIEESPKLWELYYVVLR